MRQVFLQRLPPLFRELVIRLWQPAFELLLALDVSGFFKLPQDHAYMLLGKVRWSMTGQRHRHTVPLKLPVAGLFSGFLGESVAQQPALHLATGYL